MEQRDRVPVERRVAFRTEDGVHLRSLHVVHRAAPANTALEVMQRTFSRANTGFNAADIAKGQ